MTQWTDKHYSFNYTLTEKDIEAGSIKLDPYFVAKQWKTGSKDDSGALFHVLKTVARFGDKNDVEREVKALYAQVLGVARSFGVELEPVEESCSPALTITGEVSIDGTITNTHTHAVCDNSLWYPDDSGEWIEYDGSGQPVEDDVSVEVLLEEERETRVPISLFPNTACSWCWDWSKSHINKIVAYKIVK